MTQSARAARKFLLISSGAALRRGGANRSAVQEHGKELFGKWTYGFGCFFSFRFVFFNAIIDCTVEGLLAFHLLFCNLIISIGVFLMRHSVFYGGCVYCLPRTDEYAILFTILSNSRRSVLKLSYGICFKLALSSAFVELNSLVSPILFTLEQRIVALCTVWVSFISPSAYWNTSKIYSLRIVLTLTKKHALWLPRCCMI